MDEWLALDSGGAGGAVGPTLTVKYSSQPPVEYNACMLKGSLAFLAQAVHTPFALRALRLVVLLFYGADHCGASAEQTAEAERLVADLPAYPYEAQLIEGPLGLGAAGLSAQDWLSLLEAVSSDSRRLSAVERLFADLIVRTVSAEGRLAAPKPPTAVMTLPPDSAGKDPPDGVDAVTPRAGAASSSGELVCGRQ
jgi:hypothetical protein